MALVAPTINTMVSVCSKNILTKGCVSRATIKVYRNTVEQIGDGVAASSQKWISINSGVVLVPEIRLPPPKRQWHKRASIQAKVLRFNPFQMPHLPRYLNLIFMNAPSVHT